MRLLFAVAIVMTLAFSSPLVAQGPKRAPVAKSPSDAAPTKSNAADASYAIGFRMGENLRAPHPRRRCCLDQGVARRHSGGQVHAHR